MKQLKQVKQTNIFTEKIYINTNTNTIPLTLTLFKSTTLCKKTIDLKDFLINEDIIIHLYSDEGIFSIENNQIYKLIPHDIPIKKLVFEKDDFNNIDLIFDNSYFEKTQILSQIPSNHIVHSFTKKRYSLTKNFKSLLHLIIEEISGKPVNYYFLLNDAYSFNNILVKKELNMFLSLFN